MTSFLIKHLIKTPDAVNDPQTRTAYGKLASVVGIFCNVLLFVGKLLAGLISGSIAIMADAVNNLSDAASSIVSLLGFKLATKSPDEKHPYGYARYEYLAGLSVSVMIVAIGLSLGKESIEKILSPEETLFSWLSVGILIVSILVKLWMAVFNRKIGKTINSDTLVATAADSRNDVISTAAVLVSMFVGLWTGFPIVDGIMGLLVALFIVYSGVGLVKETMSPLLGESPDPTLVSRIENKVLGYKNVLGMHDLMVHDYGPGHQFASLHIEMPAELDPMESHDIIDTIENDFLENDGLLISIHYDPIVTADERVATVKLALSQALDKYNSGLHFHDLRLVPGDSHTNVLFDLVLPAGDDFDKQKIAQDVAQLVKQIDPKFVPKFKMEHNFSGSLD